MIRLPILRALVALLILGAAAQSAVGAPTIADGTTAPAGWSRLDTAGALWTQTGFGESWPGSAVVQVNASPDGSVRGDWSTKATLPGPLRDGVTGSLALAVADLEGRHAVRVVVDGAAGSPLLLGVLQLDRSPPTASQVAIRSNADGYGGVEVSWLQDDRGLSGTDPTQPTVVEANAGPNGDESGAWVPFSFQPSPGDGPRSARMSPGRLTDGRHAVRVRSIDRAGNAAVRSLGAISTDQRAPVVSDVRAVRAPSADDPTVELAYRVSDPETGSGLAAGARAIVAPATGGPPLGDGPLGPGELHTVVRLPGPGTWTLTVRVTDRAGLVGESASVVVAVPAKAAPATVEPPPEAADLLRVEVPRVGTVRPSAPAAAITAYRAAQRVHAKRGVPLTARLVAATTRRQWSRLLGVRDAGRYEGYTTFRGDVLLGPPVTGGLEALDRARRRAFRAWRPAAARPIAARADLDRMVSALAVLLHETLHATGPEGPEDARDARSDRAFEEGVTEAATVDLLPALVREMRLPRALERGLLAATRRYAPVYPKAVRWVRGLSAAATHAAASSSAARAWRVTVADRWGPARWTLLASALGRPESGLRASAPQVAPASGRR